MGLLIQHSTGLTESLPIQDTFVVTVHHRTRGEIEQLETALTGKSEDDKAAVAAKFYLATWTGLTPAICRKLGTAVPDTQPVDQDGFIPFDGDNARDLWRNAYSNKFMLPVMLCSREILNKIETEKELAKNGFGGWSQPSTTL